MGPRTEVCLLIGYPKGTKGGIFYNPRDQRVIVSTNARFLEGDYMMDHKPMSKIVLKELRGDGHVGPSVPTVQEENPQETAQRITNDVPVHVVPRRSGRVVVQLDRWTGLGESSDSGRGD